MLLRSLFGVLSLRLLGVALTLGHVVLVTLWVSPLEYGRYSLVLSVALVLAAPLLSWPNQGALRYGREDFIKTGSFGAIFAARAALHLGGLVLLAPLLGLILPHLAFWLDVPAWPLFLLLGGILILYPASEFANVMAQIVGRYLVLGLSPVVQRLVQIAVLWVMITRIVVDWRMLLASNILGYAAALLLLGAMMPLAALRPMQVRAQQVRRLLAYSWAMPLASLSAFVMSQMDLWFLRYFSPLEGVGVYAWAYNVSLLATSVLVPLSAVLAPRSIDWQVENQTVKVDRLLRLMHATLILASALMPLLLGTALWAFTWLPLGAYEAARAPLFILAAGTLFQMGMALLEPLIFSCRPLVTPTVLLFAAMATINAILDSLLIPLFGLLGPAVATATAFAIGMVAEWHLLAGHHAAGLPPKPWLRLLWVSLPLLFLYPLFSVPQQWAPLLAGIQSFAMILLARRLGWFMALGELQPRLWGATQPLLVWLVQPRVPL